MCAVNIFFKSSVGLAIWIYIFKLAKENLSTALHHVQTVSRFKPTFEILFLLDKNIKKLWGKSNVIGQDIMLSLVNTLDLLKMFLFIRVAVQSIGSFGNYSIQMNKARNIPGYLRF